MKGTTAKQHSKLAGILSKYGIVFALILIVAAFACITDRFFTASNALNILRQVSIKGIVSIGMCFVILTGGIDLSVGSIMALSGIVVANMLKAGTNMYVCILCGCLVGVACGLVNGFFVAYRTMPAFVVTMAVQLACRGLSYILSDAKPISNLPDHFLTIGKGSFLSVPIPVWILAVVFLISLFILEHTVIGRHLYAVGGNKQTALVSGVNVRRVELFAYIMSGILCGLAATIMTARVSSALSQAAEGYESDAIAAAVIGGFSLAGGKGKLWGAIIGILMIGVINNGMDIVGVNSYYQKIVMGVIIVLAIQIDLISHKD